jgi:hypothetical protein
VKIWFRQGGGLPATKVVTFFVTSISRAFPLKLKKPPRSRRLQKSPLEIWGLEGFDLISRLRGTFHASRSDIGDSFPTPTGSLSGWRESAPFTNRSIVTVLVAT